MISRQINVDGVLLSVVRNDDGSEDVFRGTRNVGYLLPNIEDGTWDYSRMFDSQTVKRFGYGLTFDNAVRALIVTA